MAGKPTDEEGGEIKITLQSLGRDKAPSPITAGGVDGTVQRASGGTTTTQETQVIGLYGPGGLYTYGGGGGKISKQGPAGYGGGR